MSSELLKRVGSAQFTCWCGRKRFESRSQSLGLWFLGGPLSLGPRQCESDHRPPQVIANADTL